MDSEKVVSIKAGVSRITVALHDRSGRITDLLVRKTARDLLSGLESEPILSFPDRWGSRFRVVLISVVPQITEWMKKGFSGNTRIALLCPSVFDWGMPIDYLPEKTLGIDRIAACQGALTRYPDLSGRSFVVADFGTHTVLTLCRKGTIAGGSIASGIPLQLQSIGGGLVLGSYSLRLPERIVGQTTAEGISTGTILGSVRGVEGIFDDMNQESGGGLELILTGGLSRLLRRFFRVSVRCDRQLIHYGAWGGYSLGRFGAGRGTSGR